jgi:mycothiol synthase
VYLRDWGYEIMLTIRPFDSSDADYQARVDIWNAHFPSIPRTVEEDRYSDAVREPGRVWGRVMGEEDGQRIATGVYGEPLEVDSPGEYLVYIQVRPGFERRGIGSAMYECVMGALEKHDPATLMSFACEEELDHVRFLEKRGYKTVMREQDSRLDVASFDASRFADVLALVEEMGVEIRTATELATEKPGWEHEIYELDWILAQDEPRSAPPRRFTFEEYSKYNFDAPGYMADACFIAIKNGRIVGRSGLWRRPGTDKKIFTGLTGTAREERRKGIATALKIRGIEYARQHGYPIIETNNEESNPMYTLNVSLGFRPVPGWWWMRKTL